MNFRAPSCFPLALLVLLAFGPGLLVRAPAEEPAASTPPPAASPSPSAGPALNVLAASYNFGSQHADVTARVRDLLGSDAVFRANPTYLGADPHRGQNKALVIFCEVDGKRAIFSAGEGENVSRELVRERATLLPGETTVAATVPPPATAPAKSAWFLPVEGLWLGDPEVDPAEARARALVQRTVHQFYSLTTSLNEYNRVGRRDPRWDDDARQALRLYAHPPLNDPNENAACSAAFTAALHRALHEGCDDPLLAYLALRQRAYADNPSNDELARRYTDAERGLLASDYSTMRKFFGCVRALQADFDCRHNADGTVGKPGSGTMQPAQSWPKGSDVKASFAHGYDLFLTLLRGTDLPPSMYYDGMEDFLELASADPAGVAEVLEPLEKLFGSDAFKEPTYRTRLIEGRFWIAYAWQARGCDWASAVTENGWRLFGERLAKARVALEAAWKLDPTQEEAPRAMLTVVLGQGDGGGELDRWFRRANDALPDQYTTGLSKLLCLEPKWGGSAEEMIAFGRQCLATHDWATRMPFVLYEVHYRLAQYSDNFLGYWKQPEVWADMHGLFEAYLEANPTYYRDRTNYALCAYRAGDWKVAHEQFERLGDRPAVEQLQHEHYSFEQYQQMRREAREHAAATP